jgi:hypothetical protein
MFALQKCRTIRIYGFHWQQGHGVPHHYFNTEKPLAVRPAHPIIFLEQ